MILKLGCIFQRNSLEIVTRNHKQFVLKIVEHVRERLFYLLKNVLIKRSR